MQIFFEDSEEFSLALKAAAWQAQVNLREDVDRNLRPSAQIAASVKACEEIGIFEKYDPSSQGSHARIIAVVRELAFEEHDREAIDALLAHGWGQYQRMTRVLT